LSLLRKNPLGKHPDPRASRRPLERRPERPYTTYTFGALNPHAPHLIYYLTIIKNMDHRDWHEHSEGPFKEDPDPDYDNTDPGKVVEDEPDDGLDEVDDDEGSESYNVYEDAADKLDRLAALEWSEKTEEERKKLSEIVKERLRELAKASSLKLVVMGDKRSLEPAGSETFGEGLDMRQITTLFGLAHTMESLLPEDPLYKHELESFFGKPVDIIDLSKQSEK